MSNKVFADRLNQCLDDIGLPTHQMERTDAFAKLMHIARFKAESILGGNALIDQALLDVLSQELEVTPEWLLGKASDETDA